MLPLLVRRHAGCPLQAKMLSDLESELDARPKGALLGEKRVKDVPEPGDELRKSALR